MGVKITKAKSAKANAKVNAKAKALVSKDEKDVLSMISDLKKATPKKAKKVATKAKAKTVKAVAKKAAVATAKAVETKTKKPAISKKKFTDDGKKIPMSNKALEKPLNVNLKALKDMGFTAYEGMVGDKFLTKWKWFGTPEGEVQLPRVYWVHDPAPLDAMMPWIFTCKSKIFRKEAVGKGGSAKWTVNGKGSYISMMKAMNAAFPDSAPAAA